MLIALILLAGLIAATQWRASVREHRALAEYGPEGDIFDVNGINVHARIMGSGPDLILIHGASGNIRDFTFDFAERLTHRYRVIIFDRPGFGWTDRLPENAGAWNSSSESPQEQAALLQAAADQIGVRNPIVLGHSYGGAVALAWGLARPDDTAALVLVSAVSNPWPGGLGALYRINGSALGGALLIPLITAFTPEWMVRETVAGIFAPQSAPEGYARHVGPSLTLRRSSMRANAEQVNSLRPHIVEMSQHYDTLPMPIEQVHGTSDTIVPVHIHAEVLATQAPGAHLTRLTGIGHMPHHTASTEVIAAINRAALRAGLR